MRRSFLALMLFCCTSWQNAFALEVVDCDLLPESGCLYLPQKNQTYRQLLVFIRGRFQEGTNTVPLIYRRGSALKLLDGFGLKQQAKKYQLAVLAVGSSDRGFFWEDWEKIKEKYKLSDDTKLTVASHSAGYLGLHETLRHWKGRAMPISKILMLDNFYQDKAEDLKALQDAVDGGVECLGYLTPQSVAAQQKYYQNIACRLDGPKGTSHVSSAAFCLAAYIEGKPCLP